MMQVIEGPEVDLISPFPTNQAHRVYGWMQCFKSLHTTDDSPKTKAEFDGMIMDYINRMESFGVIDKYNRLGLKHPAPLVGTIAFETGGPTNKYIHFASTRTAWGTGIMDQALQLAMNYMFQKNGLFRVSGLLLTINRPARAFLRRNGFINEGILRGMASKDSTPQDMIHLGAFKDTWVYNPKEVHIKES